MKPALKKTLLALPVAAIIGCAATSAKWVATINADPDLFNQVIANADGNAVHVYRDNNQLTLATYDQDGNLLNASSLAQLVEQPLSTLDLANGHLAVIGSRLSDSLFIDTNTGTAQAPDSSLFPDGATQWPLAGVIQTGEAKLTFFGTRTTDNGAQGWLLVFDQSTSNSQLIELPGLTSVDSVFYQGHTLFQGALNGTAHVVTLDAALNESGRFAVPDPALQLIGESLGRAVFLHEDTKNVSAYDAVGNLAWEWQNTEFAYIKGQSVGPDGSTLLWGDNSAYNVVAGIRTDEAHFLRLDAEGALSYHYTGDDAMASIKYKHVKQFDDGRVQITYQGSSGELTGFLVGSNVATPFTVTRAVYHDFISPTGSKSRWMRETKRIETYQQCGFLCMKIVSETAGHCDNLDVFNINSKNLFTLTQVCGETDPHTVRLSYY